jgi:hypothetical protein
MSSDDITFLTGLVAIPTWTFVALPLSYGDVPMDNLASLVLGTVVSIALGTFFFQAVGRAAQAGSEIASRRVRETSEAPRTYDLCSD